MGHLAFACPKTGRKLATFVGTDDNTLLTLRRKPLSMLCPFCGDQHEWRVSLSTVERTGPGVSERHAPFAPPSSHRFVKPTADVEPDAPKRLVEINKAFHALLMK